MQNQNDVKYILFWTDFFQWKNWKLKQDISDQRFFEEISCPETRCVITSDRTLKEISEYDAILFHAVKPWNSIPEKRSREQMYVAGMLESPERTESNLAAWDNFFNLTSKVFTVKRGYSGQISTLAFCQDNTVVFRACFQINK
jgi:hypothetical protein